MSSSVAQQQASKRPPRTRRGFWSMGRFFLFFGLLIVVVVAAAFIVPTTRWVSGSGYLMTDQEAELRPSVEGALAAWHVRTGANVEQDQLIIELNASVQKAELEQARGELRTREAELAAVLSNQELEKRAREQQIARAEQNLKLAQNYLERMTGGGFSPKEVDEARLKLEIATSQLAELRLPRQEVMDKQVAVLREQVESAKKKVATHEAQVKMRQVRAPLAGIVQLNRFEPGEVVKPDHVLGQVFDPSAWVVKLKLPEESANFVQPGQEVEVALAAYSTLRYGYLKATVDRIVPVVTPRQQGNGVYYAEAKLELPKDLKIQPGMTATGYVNAGRTNWVGRLMGW